MAIVHNTDMLYTRPGAAESNVLSAHDPLIWEFQDGGIVGGPATATVQFVVKDNDLATIYTSAAFPAYLLSYADPLAKFRFDGTQILKHIINNYLYKEISTIIAPENYGSTVDVVFKTYDDAVQNATDTVTYYLSQAVNQIGDEYGSNIPRLFLNDTEDIAHFLGYPTKIFFYLATDRSAHSPLVEIIDRDITESANLITEWSNVNYQTFNTTGTAIDSAISTLEGSAISRSLPESQFFTIVEGQNYLILVPAFVLNSGELPLFFIYDHDTLERASNELRPVVGDNAFILIATASSVQARLWVWNDGIANWSCGPVHVIPVEDASGYGSLKLGVHCIDLGLLTLSKKSIYARAYYDHDEPIKIKDYNLHIFEACENAIFIRWLNSNGDYSYWAFSPYPFRDKSGDRLGSVINNFAEMALANSRNLPLGYRDAFDKISVIASAVPLLFRRKMLEIFTSPAVYLWNGIPSENLISEVVTSGSHPYETFTTDGTIIISAINTVGNGFAFFTIDNTGFSVKQGDILIVIFDLNLNSGQDVDISIRDETLASVISNTVTSATGFNFITLTITSDGDDARLFFANSAASNYSTSAIIVKRKEKELDWILLNRVEGSHNLMLKKDNDNFECTLVLPENYTQQLSGQNI